MQNETSVYMWIVLTDGLSRFIPLKTLDDRLQFNAGRQGWISKPFVASSTDYRMASWRIRSDMLDELNENRYTQQLVDKQATMSAQQNKVAATSNWDAFLHMVEDKTGLSIKQIQTWSPEQLSRYLLERNDRMKKAFHDAILQPKGVVPDSGMEFYDQTYYDKRD